MLAWLVIISLIVLVPATIASRLLASQVYRYMAQHHPTVWKDLNTPSNSTQNSPFFSRRGSFLLKHQYKKLNDPILERKAYWAFIAFQVMLGSLIILTLSAFSYEFLVS